MRNWVDVVGSRPPQRDRDWRDAHLDSREPLLSLILMGAHCCNGVGDNKLAGLQTDVSIAIVSAVRAVRKQGK